MTEIPEHARLAEHARAVLTQVARVYVGPPLIPKLLMASVLARGHVLLEGVPGVAKTTLVKAFSAALGCDFRRVQFTPDLLPADITGTFVLSPRDGVFALREGPIFAHVVLGDEINRAPAKTQSALLEAMQEGQVTIEGETRDLPRPFFVLATQNPVELTGTYPLPEAQTDRFLMRLSVGYPNAEDERDMLRRSLDPPVQVNAVLDVHTLLTMQACVRRVHVDESILAYIVRFAHRTRTAGQFQLGASPRASLAWLHAARAWAFLEGRHYVIPDDVQLLAVPVLAHRVLLTQETEMRGTTAEHLLRRLVTEVPHRDQED